MNTSCLYDDLRSRHPQGGRPVPAAQRRRNSHGGFHAHARLVTLLLAQSGGQGRPVGDKGRWAVYTATAAYGGARGVQGARGGAAMTEGRWYKKAQPLPWYGGKQSKAEWLHSLIPWRKDSTYVEPFGGQAGLLTYRAPVRCEIFNDLDHRIVNWWACVRKYRKELGELIEGMPHSEYEHERACVVVDDESATPLDRSLAFYVLATSTISNNMKRGNWRESYQDSGIRRWRSGRVDMLCERMWNVQLFCRPAENILARVADMEDAVIYADPPYHTADTSNYNVCKLDIPALTKLFLSQRGGVAVSGYRDEWDHLEWQKHEKQYLKSFNGSGKSNPSTEVLWTNYDAMQPIGGLFADHVEALQ